jgi:glycosyltransferase involved in cell wall biosynthesis
MAETINQTILSIISQEGNFSIRYHVQDGESTDGTVDILKEWEQRLNELNSPFVYCNGVTFTYRSEPDKGMYDAIDKGFSFLDIPDSSFMTWLNADDKLLPQSLLLINSLYQMADVNWITGNLFNFQQDNGLIFNWFVPFPPSKFIAQGVCDLIHWSCLEQEGTFWRKWLWDKAGGIDTTFQFAGDWDLWRRFAQHSELIQVAYPLGAFRKQNSQLSAQDGGSLYREEIDASVPLSKRQQAIKEMAQIGTDNLCYKFLNYAGNRYTLVNKAIKNLYPPWCKGFANALADSIVDKNTKTTPFNRTISTTQPVTEQLFHNPLQGRPTFIIVTPCLNAAATIDKTINSVIAQTGNFTIRYHVQDGGSTDSTIERLRYWKNLLDDRNSIVKYGCIKFTWSSEFDNGMYDAITKGFDTFFIAPDDYMAWINADDQLLPDALSTVARILMDYPEVQWIGGAQYVIENDKPILQRDVPTPSYIIEEGLCDGKHWEFLQQEGMFFKKRLWFKGKHALRGFKYAGDWSLWREFARHAELVQFEKPLGAFYRREGQLSISHFEDYQREINAVLPIEMRKKTFGHLPRDKSLYRKVIKDAYPSDSLLLEKDEASVRIELKKRQEKFK